MVRSWGAAAVVAAVLMVTTAACSDSDKSITLPSASAQSATASTPPGDYSKSRVGAADFARSFVTAMSRALVDGDTAWLTAHSTSGCMSCARLTGFVERSHRDGGRIIGGELTIHDAVALPLQGDLAEVTVILSQAAGRVVDAHGITESRIEKLERIDAELRLRWVADAWFVARLTQHVGGNP